jgi:hypothetical protein
MMFDESVDQSLILEQHHIVPAMRVLVIVPLAGLLIIFQKPFASRAPCTSVAVAKATQIRIPAMQNFARCTFSLTNKVDLKPTFN